MDKESPDKVDAHAAAETTRLLKEMDALIERARILILDRQRLIAVIDKSKKKDDSG